MANYFSSQFADDYRKVLEQQNHPYKDLTDIELTQVLARKIKDEGRDMIDMPEDFQVSVQRVNNKTPEEYRGDNAFSVGAQEFGKGLKSGWETTKGGYKAVVGLGAGMLGDEEMEEDWMLAARRNFEKGSEVGSTMRGKGADTLFGPEFDGSAAGRWLASGAGEALASTADLIVSVLVGGGVAAGLKHGAVTAAKKTAVAGAVARGVPLNTAKTQASAVLPRNILGGSANLSPAMAQTFTTAGGVASGVTGFGTSAGQNTGHVYSDLYEFTKEPEYIEQDGEKIKNPRYMSPEEARKQSIIVGAASGSFDSILPAYLVGRLSKKIGTPKALQVMKDFVEKMPAGSILNKTILPVVGVGAAESVTETAQEVLQMAVVKNHTGEEWGSEDFKRLFEAGALGFMGGGQVAVGIETGKAVFNKLGKSPSQEAEERGADRSTFEPTNEEIEQAKLKAFEDKTTKFQEGDKVNEGLDRSVEYEVTRVHPDGKIDVQSGDGKSVIYARDGGLFTKARTPEAEPEPEVNPEAEAEPEEQVKVDEHYKIDGDNITVGGEVVGEIQYTEQDGTITYDQVAYAKENTDKADPDMMDQVARKEIRKRAEEKELGVNLDKEGNRLDNAETTEDLTTDAGILSALRKAVLNEKGIYSEKLVELTKEAEARGLLIDGNIPSHLDGAQDNKLTAADRIEIKTRYDLALESAKKEAEISTRPKDVSQWREVFDIQDTPDSKARRIKQAINYLLASNNPDLFTQRKNGQVDYVGKVEGKDEGERIKAEAAHKEKLKAIELKSSKYPVKTLFNRSNGFVFLESFNEETGETVWYNPETKEREKKSWDDTKNITAKPYNGKKFVVENGEAKKVKPKKKVKIPKVVTKKTDRNLGYYTRKEEDDPQTGQKKYTYTLKPGEVHKGTRIPAALEREPIIEPSPDGEYDVVVGFKDGDNEILFGDKVREDVVVTEGGEAITVNGIPLFKNKKFPNWKFNQAVKARLPEGSTIYTKTTTRGTSKPTGETKETRPERYEDISTNSVIKTLRPTELELVLTNLFQGTDIEGMTPAQYLAAQLFPNLDVDNATDDQIKTALREAGVLSPDNLQEAGGYSKVALVMTTPEGRVVVRSIFFTHEGQGKGNIKNFGIGNYKLVVYQSQLKGSGKFNPRAMSKSGNPATDSYTIPVGDVEGSPFTEDTTGSVYVNGDNGLYRVIGFIKGNNNFHIGHESGNFLNFNGLKIQLEKANSLAIENRTPYTRFLNDQNDKDVRGSDGTYNPYLHVYSELSLREKAKDQVKKFALQKKQQIEQLIGADLLFADDFDAFLDILADASKTGLLRVRDLDALETALFSVTKSRKGSHIKAREEQYQELDDSMHLIRRLYFSDKFGANNDRNSGQEQHRWYQESEKADPDTLKSLLFEGGKIPKSLSAQLKKIYAKFDEVLSLRLFKNSTQLNEDGEVEGINQTPTAGVLYNYFFVDKVKKADGTEGPRFEKIPQTEEEYNALARKIRDIRLMQDVMDRLNTNQEIGGELVDILQYYFFEAKDADMAAAQEEVDDAIDTAIAEWQETIQADKDSLQALEDEANLLQEGLVKEDESIFKQINEKKEKIRISESQIEMLEALKEQVIERMQNDPAFNRAVSKGTVPMVNKDAANELVVLGKNLGFDELGGLSVAQISSNLPALKAAVQKLAEEQPVPMSIIEQTDVLDMSDTDLSRALQGAMEGQNAPTAIGLLLFGENGLFQDERKMDAWNHDINSQDGTRVGEALTTSGIDTDTRKQLGMQQATQDGIDDDGAMSLAEGGFGITTASEEEANLEQINHPSEVHEDPEAAIEQDKRIKMKLMGTADPAKPVTGKAILKRIQNLTQNKTTRLVLDMLQPLMRELDNVNIVWATREEWSKFQAPGKWRKAVFQTWDNNILMGDFHAKANEDGSLKTDEEVMEFLIRTIAEELQHSVLYSTINAVQHQRDYGIVNSKYNGRMSLKELKEFGRISAHLFNFLNRQATKEGIFNSHLRNEQELWANYASDPAFREWVDSLEFDPQTRNSIQTKFQKVKDFIIRLLSRVFSSFKEASALEIMDDHLRQFYADSNQEASLEGESFSSQEMFSFMPKTKPQKVDVDVDEKKIVVPKGIPKNMIQAISEKISWGTDLHSVRQQTVSEAVELMMQNPTWTKSKGATFAYARRVHDMLQDYQEMHKLGDRLGFQDAALKGELIKPRFMRKGLYSEEKLGAPIDTELTDADIEDAMEGKFQQFNDDGISWFSPAFRKARRIASELGIQLISPDGYGNQSYDGYNYYDKGLLPGNNSAKFKDGARVEIVIPLEPNGMVNEKYRKLLIDELQKKSDLDRFGDLQAIETRTIKVESETSDNREDRKVLLLGEAHETADGSIEIWSGKEYAEVRDLLQNLQSEAQGGGRIVGGTNFFRFEKAIRQALKIDRNVKLADSDHGRYIVDNYMEKGNLEETISAHKAIDELIEAGIGTLGTAKKHSGKEYIEYLETIKSITDDVDVEFTTEISKGAAGFWRRGGTRAYVHPAYRASSTGIHEIVHATIGNKLEEVGVSSELKGEEYLSFIYDRTQQLDKNDPIRAYLEAYLQAVDSIVGKEDRALINDRTTDKDDKYIYLNQGGTYGVFNIHEFATEIFSDNAFQKRLAEIEVPKHKEYKNLFTFVVEAIRNLLKWEISQTLLEKGVMASAEIMGEEYTSLRPKDPEGGDPETDIQTNMKDNFNSWMSDGMELDRDPQSTKKASRTILNQNAPYKDGGDYSAYRADGELVSGRKGVINPNSSSILEGRRAVARGRRDGVYSEEDMGSDNRIQASRNRINAPSDIEQNIQLESVATSEVMKVVNEVASELPEEMQTELVEKLLKDRLARIPGRGKSPQLKKALTERLKSLELGKGAQDYGKAITEMGEENEVKLKDSIDEFETQALRMRAVDRAIRMMNSTRMWTHKFLNKRVNEARGTLPKLQAQKETLQAKLNGLTDKKKYNPESTKQVLLEETQKLLKQGLHQVLTNEVADYGLARLANSVNVNNLYDFLTELIRQGVAVEQYTAQEIYDQFNISASDLFEGINGERQDNVAKAVLAKLLGSDTKRQKKAKRAFSLDMRIAMDAPTRNLTSEWTKLEQALISNNWKQINTDGLLGTQIQEAQNIRKEMELLDKKMEILAKEISLSRMLIQGYDKRIKLYKDYMGEVYMPNIRMGEDVVLLTYDKEGRVVAERVPYDVRGDGLTKLLQAIQRTRKILSNPELTTRIDDVYMEYFKRVVNEIGEKPLSKIHHASVTGYFASHLEPIVKLLSRSGVEGMEASASIIKFFNEYREKMSEFVGQGQQVNLALEKFKKEFASVRGLFGRDNLSDLQFREYFLDPFRTFVENRPDTAEWETAAKKFWNEYKPDGDFNYTEKAKNLWLSYVRELVIATNKVMRESKDAGLSIETDIMIVDPLLSSISSGQVLKPLHRREIPVGAITTPRFIYVGKIAKAYNSLLRGKKTEDRIINHVYKKLKELAASKEVNRASIDASLSRFKGLDDNLEMNFLDPLFSDDTNPRNVGYSIGKDVISMGEVREAWEASEGKNVGAKLADMMKTLIGEELTNKEYASAVANFFSQMNARAEAIIKTHVEIGERSDSNIKNPDAIHYGTQVWSSLNSREEATKLPSSFFTYTMFTEMDMQRLLGKVLQAKYFGRNREGLDSTFASMKVALEEVLREYSKIQSKYTSYRTRLEDIVPTLDIDGKVTTRLKLSRRAKGILSKDDQKRLSQLHTEALALMRGRKMQSVFMKFINSNDDSSEVDTDAFLETIQTIAGFAVSNPKSALNNLAQMWEIVNMYGVSIPGAKHVTKVLLGLPREAAISLAESFGKTILRNLDGERELRRYWVDLKQAMPGRYSSRGMEGELIDGKLFSAKAYRRLVRQLRNWRMGQGGVKARGKIKDDLKGVPAGLSTPIPFVGNPFGWASQALNKYTALSILNDLTHRIKKAVAVLDELEVDPTDQSKELTAEEMGFADTKISRMVHGSYQIFERLDNVLFENGTSITQLAQDYRRRRESDRNAAVMTPQKMVVAWSIATHEISFDSSMAKPRVIQDSYLGRVAAPLLGWSTSRLGKTSELIRDNKNEGRISKDAIIRLTYQFLAAGIPISMAVVLLGELYDEEMLGKDSGLGKVSPKHLLPFGSVLAMGDDDYNGVAVVERLARTSSIGGIAQELGSAFVLGQSDQGRVPRDPLNRILFINLATSLADVGANLYATGGKIEYSSTIRPLMYATGLNGLIQAQQMATNLVPEMANMPILSEERQVTDVISYRSLLRTYGRALGVEVMKSGGGMNYRPNRMTLAIRKMERTAYANDRTGFMDAFRDAQELSQALNPIKDVIDRFKRRNLRNGVAKYAMSDYDFNLVMSVMDEEDRSKINKAISNHNYYLQLIGGSPSKARKQNSSSIDTLRLNALR